MYRRRRGNNWSMGWFVGREWGLKARMKMG
jgi:hypothetical protein